MQKGLKPKDSEWAIEGTMLHNAVATRNMDGLNDEQKTAVTLCIEFLEDIAGDVPKDNIRHEDYLEMKNGNGDVITAGLADVVITGKKLIVIDFKFGYNEVNDVNSNIQLASYSLGAMQKYNYSECESWVFQPRIRKKSNHVFKNATAIAANIEYIKSLALRDELYLNATEKSCRYCLARLNCPAFRMKFQKLNACKENYDLSDVDTLVELYDASKGIKSFLAEVESSVKSMIEQRGSCGKYVFQISDGAREIKDLNSLYAIVKDYLTPQEFNSVCKLTLGKFESLLSDKLISEAEVNGEKLTKTDAKKMVYGMISSLITKGNPVKKIVEKQK